MNKHVYAEWDDFQIVPPTYLDGRFDPDKFDVVKWVKLPEPIRVRCWNTGEYKWIDRSCFSIGLLVWNRRDLNFKFESVGLRYLEEHKDGLEKFLLDFCEKEQTKRV